MFCFFFFFFWFNIIEIYSLSTANTVRPQIMRKMRSGCHLSGTASLRVTQFFVPSVVTLFACTIGQLHVGIHRAALEAQLNCLLPTFSAGASKCLRTQILVFIYALFGCDCRAKETGDFHDRILELVDAMARGLRQ
uniref:Putative secreted protein n=1 Tax=Rhipicephalus microplus TaxID=6941 RepID=A0A6M2D958_RHIMP